ncbi:putative LPS assembly protein LptD [Flavobacteriaceae bacterium]|nr:putative LPS assembly protein LptD [Flavobacteriaceae bacterium]
MAKDSIAKDSIAPKKEVLDAIIVHTAKDSIVEDVLGKKIRLYNEGHVQYGDIDLQAGFIEINYDTSIITAKGVKDSLGEYTQLPVFKQGREESVQDSLFYNFETEKAIIFHVQTTQSGIITLGEETKKVNDSTIYIRDIRFTTSEKKNPDYYLKTRKAKIVPNKKIVTGTTNLVIADVPTPIALPFAYFPLTQDKASGFLLPTYSETRDQGFSLQNGGYYFAFSDYFDLALTGDIYSNGSWGLTANSSYRVRYKFNGRFSYAYENNIYGIQGFDDYSKSTNYNIRWNQSQDAKASPNSNFSASVNLGSSKYYRESLNENNSGDYLNNTLASSINYSKTFVGTPFNLSVGFNHSQNTNTEQINMSLPSLKVNMDRIYPFSPKSGTASNPIQKIGLTYGLKADNRVQTTDDEFFTDQMWQDMQSGVQQDISASTNMKAFKYWTISPNANYKEVWYFDYIDKNFDEDTEMVVTDTIQGFSSFREYNVGASLSTNIYGSFGKIGPLEAMRHTLRPSVSYTYRPDFGYYYEEVPETADNTSYETYSKYDTGIYGAPSQGLSNSIGLSLNNTLEAKVKPKDSTETESRKITLLNNLNFSTSYNMAADSLKWSPTNVTAGTAFLQDKLRVNMGMTLDPYAINANGTKINVANINNGGSLFRITRANLTANYAFSSKDFDGDNAERNSSENITDQGSGTEGLLGTNMSASRSPDINDDVGGTEKDKEKQEFFKNKIPWSLKVAYSLNYNNSVGQSEISSNSLMFSGDLEFTPKWLLGFSSGYDFKDNGVTYTQLRFSRDLDSWRINFNWVPFGDRTSYYFYIGVKSSMLSDLKYEKNSQPDQRLF